MRSNNLFSLILVWHTPVQTPRSRLGFRSFSALYFKDEKFIYPSVIFKLDPGPGARSIQRQRSIVRNDLR